MVCTSHSPMSHRFRIVIEFKFRFAHCVLTGGVLLKAEILFGNRTRV